MNYKYSELAMMAKRDNNTKRPFLLVNPLQGKHLPVSPNDAILMIESLASKVFNSYPDEKLLIIGFAETATAIGAVIANYSSSCPYYIHTTREPLLDCDYLFFTESHSHATEQKLIRNHLHEIFSSVDRIIFAEDEVTTGNTIEKIIHLLLKEYPEYSLKFGIASILNGMSYEKISELRSRDILCHYLNSVDLNNYQNTLDQYSYLKEQKLAWDKNFPKNNISSFNNIILSEKTDPRLGISTSAYKSSVNLLYEQLINELPDLNNKSILILGTEEFMYPGLYIGSLIEKNSTPSKVRFHATTRSPILPSVENDYPLKERYELVSYYDEQRTTFLYNLNYYDIVVIISDTTEDTNGVESLATVLSYYGCENIYNINWRIN